MRWLVLLAALAILGGCASMGQVDGQRTAAINDARAKLEFSGCNMALVEEIRRLKEPGLELEAGYQCLQQGELAEVERLLSDYRQRHVSPPYPDYADYLLGLSALLRFELLGEEDPERLELGREVHRQLAGFVRAYPQSSYREGVGQSLKAVLDGMARTEYRLAQEALAQGDNDAAAARLRYVVQQYPRSAAAGDAASLLERHGAL